MSAGRETQWNERGRAKQPRVCRERGGGEAPGTSMSRLNIYPYIIAWRCRERGSWGAVGRFGVVHNLVWRDLGSTGVRPQNVGGGSQDPVTRSWECARRGGQTSARKLLPFFPLSVFLRGHILKRLAHTNGLF
ncbi:hypothetical protein E2I00_016113, partial [Balaenoptera physalus]